MTFEIKEHSPVKLTNFNARVEKHGSESVPACDLTFQMDAPNSVLTYFSPELLESLYKAVEQGAEDEQEELDGVDPITSLPLLRFPELSPLKFEKKHAGFALNIDYGLGGDSSIDITGCEVGKFVLDPKEGGTVQVKFQVQCQSGLTEQIMGKLAMMNGQEVSIRLTAPMVQQATTIETQENPFPVQGKETQLTAEQVFLQGSDIETAAVH